MKRRVLFATPFVLVAATSDVVADLPRKPPGPVNPPRPVIGRVIKTQVAGETTILTIERGKRHGVARDWRGCVLDRDTTRCLPDGDFVIIRVAEHQTIAKAKLPPDRVQRNPRVRLDPE